MLVYGECECFVMQMLYVCVLGSDKSRINQEICYPQRMSRPRLCSYDVKHLFVFGDHPTSLKPPN